MSQPALVHDHDARHTSVPSLRGLHVLAGGWATDPRPTTPFRPSRTEPGRRIRALVEALAADGTAQTVVTAGPRPAGPVPDRPIHVVTVPARGHDLPVVRTVSAAMALAGAADIVHLHVTGRESLVALATLATTVPRPLVVHLHGSHAVPLRTGGTASWRGRVVDATFEGRILAAAAAVVVPSPRLAEVAHAAGATHVAVVPPAVLPVTSAGDVPLPGLGAGRRIVSVGPLTARRRPAALVRALALQPPDTHLLLLGSGPRRLEVDQEVRHLGLGGRVHVLPTLSWQVVTDHVAHADVVATAALSGEDTTATLLAMAAGRPTVGTAVEGLPAIVSSGVDGLLVPPGDDEALAAGVRSILTDRDRAAALGASAARRVAAADWLRHAAGVRALAAPAVVTRVGDR